MENKKYIEVEWKSTRKEFWVRIPGKAISYCVYYDRNGNFKDERLYKETRWVYRDNKLLNDVRDIVFNRKEENENEWN